MNEVGTQFAAGAELLLNHAVSLTNQRFGRRAIRTQQRTTAATAFSDAVQMAAKAEHERAEKPRWGERPRRLHPYVALEGYDGIVTSADTNHANNGSAWEGSMLRTRLILAAFMMSALIGTPLAQDASEVREYDRPYDSSVGDYPPPPEEREDFAPIDFIDVPGSTAIFTEVMVEPVHLESVKEEIRAKLPNAHVRHIISGANGSDQTLMVMWHPKEAFRPAINDYYRVLNPMRGLKGTHTYLGVSDRFPASYPSDTLLGWKFLEFDPASVERKYSELSDRLLSDPDVLEVSRLAAGGFDMVVVYRFSGASVLAMLEVKDRLQSLVGNEDILRTRDYECP